MRKCICGAFLAAFVLVVAGPARAEEGDAKAVIEKAIKALGGEEKLTKALKGCTWKTKGTFSLMGNDNEFTGVGNLQGADHLRTESESSFGKFTLVVAGDKGWLNFGGNVMDLEGDGLANEKFNAFLDASTALPVLLREKGVKMEGIAEEKVGGKAAAGIKVTTPSGKDFRLYFDKESGLPVKRVAKVTRFGPEEYTEDAYFTNYKEFDGIKRSTKTQQKRDGEKFIEAETTEFKVVDKIDAKTFTKPE